MIDFTSYHKENPNVWKAFVECAKATRARGFQRYSANGIFEIIRWHTGVNTEGQGFKVNNNFRADYARKMMDEFPEFKGFFTIRPLTAVRK